jgi:hypothetical protein
VVARKGSTWFVAAGVVVDEEEAEEEGTLLPLNAARWSACALVCACSPLELCIGLNIALPAAIAAGPYWRRKELAIDSCAGCCCCGAPASMGADCSRTMCQNSQERGLKLQYGLLRLAGRGLESGQHSKPDGRIPAQLPWPLPLPARACRRSRSRVLRGTDGHRLGRYMKIPIEHRRRDVNARIAKEAKAKIGTWICGRTSQRIKSIFAS